ncbi:hypothetical protein Tco_0788117 [Tanacetum coccineum]
MAALVTSVTMMIMSDEDGGSEMMVVDVVARRCRLVAVVWLVMRRWGVVVVYRIWDVCGCGARGIIRISQLDLRPGALNQLCTQPVCYVLYALSQYVLYALSHQAYSISYALSMCFTHSANMCFTHSATLRTQPVCALRTQPVCALRTQLVCTLRTQPVCALCTQPSVIIRLYLAHAPINVMLMYIVSHFVPGAASHVEIVYGYMIMIIGLSYLGHVYQLKQFLFCDALAS